MERVLRDVVDDDIPIFFEQQNDPEAIEMAAFPPREWEPFRAHWGRIRAGRDSCVTKTIVADDLGRRQRRQLAARRQALRRLLARPRVLGQGARAPRALAELVDELDRPLYAEVSTDEHRFDPGRSRSAVSSVVGKTVEHARSARRGHRAPRHETRWLGWATVQTTPAAQGARGTARAVPRGC